MKIGFNVFEKPVEEYFTYAVQHGLNHLEIDLIKEHSVIETFTPQRILNLKELSQKYNISGVPNTIVNHGAGSVLGGVPEGMFVEELQKLLVVA